MSGERVTNETEKTAVNKLFVSRWDIARSQGDGGDFYSAWINLVSALEVYKSYWSGAYLSVRVFQENTPAATLQRYVEAAMALKVVANKTTLGDLANLCFPASAKSKNPANDEKSAAPQKPELVLFERLSVPEKTPTVDKAVADAFDNTRYIEFGGSCQELRERLASYSSLWLHESPYYAPYNVLLNASMTGKSRMLAQFRKWGVFVITICLRPDREVTLRPPRTHPIASWIQDSIDANPLKFLNESCVLHFTLLKKLRRWLKKQLLSVGEDASLENLAEIWYQFLLSESSGMHGTGLWAAVLKKMKDTPLPTSGESSEASASESILETWRGPIEAEVAKIGKLLAEFKLLPAGGENADVRILFVVDEARNLSLPSDKIGSLNRFLYFRRSLQALPYFRENLLKTFAVFTDTTSRIANLAPPSDVDPSGRLSAQRAILFPPFVVLNNVDLWWYELRESCKDRGQVKFASVGEFLELVKRKLASTERVRSSAVGTSDLRRMLTLEVLESYTFNALFGRPAFMPFLICKDGSAAANWVEGKGIDALHSMLLNKLLCAIPWDKSAKRKLQDLDDEDFDGFNDFSLDDNKLVTCAVTSTNPQYSQAQVLGVFGAIASIDVSAASRLATDLSSSHMRWVEAVSKLRKFVYTMEVSEPVLALAAHALVDQYVPWCLILDKYVNSQLNQSTMTGFLGEVACQVLLLMAAQKCRVILRAPKFRIPFIPVPMFVEVLLGKLSARVSKRTAESFQHMREHLKGGWIRVNQIVQTISDLSIDMLCDYFVRASAIRCKHNQKAFDLCAVMNFPETPAWPKTLGAEHRKSNEKLAKSLIDPPNTAVHARLPNKHTEEKKSKDEKAKEERVKEEKLRAEKEEGDRLKAASGISARGMSLFGVQVKDRQNFLTAAEKKKWLDSIDELTFLDKNAYLPSVFLCCEFDSGVSAEGSLPESKRETLPLVARSQIVTKNGIDHVRYLIFVRRLKPTDIDESFLNKTDQAFARLLEFKTDIMTSRNIDARDIAHANQAEKVQPRYKRTDPWF